MTIGLNVIVTSLICYQLLTMSKKVEEYLGEQNAQLYTGAAAILVESAAPYTLTGIIFLIPYARSSPVGAAFGQIWAKFTVSSPLCPAAPVSAAYCSPVPCSASDHLPHCQ